jgi:hypothetical protein
MHVSFGVPGVCLSACMCVFMCLLVCSAYLAVAWGRHIGYLAVVVCMHGSVSAQCTGCNRLCMGTCAPLHHLCMHHHMYSTVRGNAICNAGAAAAGSKPAGCIDVV